MSEEMKNEVVDIEVKEKLPKRIGNWVKNHKAATVGIATGVVGVIGLALRIIKGKSDSTDLLETADDVVSETIDDSLNSIVDD